MLINSETNLNFRSRNSTIRFADDIARKINREYPRISPSKLEGLANAKKFENFLDKLWDRVGILRDQIVFYMKTQVSVKTKVENILYRLKNKRLGNCGESVLLAYIASRINGIKDCKFAYLSTPKGFDLDHAVLLVEEKKPYVIDAWFGFADYIPNAIKRYQKEYQKYFDFEKAKTQKIKIKPDNYSLYKGLEKEITAKDLRVIKRVCRNLVIKK